jgi:hypothetical protein
MAIKAYKPLVRKVLQGSAGVAAALALVLTASGPGLSQPSDPRERAAAQGPGAARPQPPAAIPGAAAKAREAQSKSGSESKPWSLEDALPDNSPAVRERIKETPAAAKPGLGRVPLQNGPGTFGLETETKVKSTEFPDGRRAPGVETTTQRPPSYFGLSISVPTSDKSIIPSIPAPFGKSE